VSRAPHGYNRLSSAQHATPQPTMRPPWAVSAAIATLTQAYHNQRQPQSQDCDPPMTNCHPTLT